MRAAALVTLAILSSPVLTAQSIGPDVTSWILNTTGATGYNGIPTNVQRVQYSANNVYVSCTCIPSYEIGPWPHNPNQAMNQNFVFRITRTPAVNKGTPVATPLGHIGVWTNGVSIFNARDARSYMDADIWHQNAIVVEGSSFDDCLGHPAPNGEYHHHLNPTCLYDDADSSRHSPIIGFAFDGFPIYGAYGFRSSDGTGGVTRMRSSFRMRAIEQRTTLPGGEALPPGRYGPAVSAAYPLGYYVEDFEYVQGLGDLDEHNGRFCVTPEYPEGTYAYFVTLDEEGRAAYPYTIGETYRGVVPPGNTGPGSGHASPAEPVITYTLSGISGERVSGAALYPNPATAYVSVAVPATGDRWRVSLIDLTGHEALALGEIERGAEATFPLETVPDGIYFVRVQSASGSLVEKLVVAGR